MGNDTEASSLLYNFPLRNTRLALYIAPYATSQGDVTFYLYDAVVCEWWWGIATIDPLSTQ